MRYRTAVKTGRTATMQLAALAPGKLLPVCAKAHAVTGRGGFAVWIVALLLLVGAFAGNRLQAQDKAPSGDLAITQRVESALAKDAVLKKLDIKVETRDGVVNLTGFVRSLEDIAKAGGVAKAVPGVSAVRNDLRVANRPSQA